MINGIIPAGGRGSRMGPLAAQISKALVSIGQRPHLAHQVQLLRDNGVGPIAVVTSPDTHRQVSDMIDRCGLRDVIAYQQGEPRGPVDAIRVAFARGFKNEHLDPKQPTYILMSDTFLDERLPLIKENPWAAVAAAPSRRSFCWREDSSSQFVDAEAATGKLVTVGLYGLPDSNHAYEVALGIMRERVHEDEVTMAPFLNEIGMNTTYVDSWMDIGDVMALARARRTRFIARSHHDLELNSLGFITKSGEGDAFLRQVTYLEQINQMNSHVRSLFPHLHSTSATHITMDFVDAPTLSELFLYWPGAPDTWVDILESILLTLQNRLWQVVINEVTSPKEEQAMFIDKAHDRLWNWNPKIHQKVSREIDNVRVLFQGSPTVFPHGDLTFNNILFSLNTGTFKLVDPRGDTRLPLSYEIAKLRYSYHGGLAAITHGLYTGGQLLPDRTEETNAMDKVLGRYQPLDKMTAAEGLLLLASAPMHSAGESAAMISRGRQMLREATA